MDEVKPLHLVVAMGLVLDVSGAMHVYGFADAKSLTREGSLATILLIIALLWLVRRPAPEHLVPERRQLWFSALPLVAGIFAVSDVLSFVDAGWSPLRLAIFVPSLLILSVLALRRAPATLIAAVAFVLGTAIRFLHIKYVPLEPARGDMLPLVQQAIGNLLAGRSPYTAYSMPWELPLTYLPLTWLAYLPAFVAGIDLRWTNLVAEAGLLGAALFVCRQQPPEHRQRTTDSTLVLWAWIFLSPTVIHWDMVTSAPIGWAALAWPLALIVAGQNRATAVALGLAAATTPLIAVVTPLIALRWWRTGGLRELLGRGVMAAAIAALLLAPWFIWAPGPFLDGTVRWFNDLQRFPGQKWEAEGTWAMITGFSGFFWEWGREGWLKPIQAVAVAAIAGLYLARGTTRVDLLGYATAALLIFTLFNPVLWPYLYNPALIAGWLAFSGAGIAATVPVMPQVKSPQSSLKRRAVRNAADV